MTDKIKVRPMNEGDLNFILATWLKSYKYSGDLVKRVREEIYFDTYEPIIKSILKRSQTLIACLDDDWEVIAGYMVTVPPSLVHYVYVKEAWRSMGIAKHLCQESRLIPKPQFTHWTTPVDRMMRKLDWSYNPFAI